MNLNRHYLLLLLIAMLLIPAQDLSAKKKKQVKNRTTVNCGREYYIEWLNPCLVI